MNNFPIDIRIQIFNYIDDELKSYWKNYFSNKIIILLNPKDYFSKHILPLLDKGWKFITLYSGPCRDCYQKGYKSYNKTCSYCFNLVPCFNCYWYNSDPYNTHGGCYCNGIQEWVSWDQIKEFYPSYKLKYVNYYDLIRSQQWLNYIKQEYIISQQIRRN